MKPLISNHHYRPEIDGLRAIAVIAVILFHADLGVPGGYVGVDVFFVISGFLITTIIVKDLQQGTFSLARFWERRARRIIPAGVVMVLATVAAGWFLLLPGDYMRLGSSAVWHSVFAGNFYFWSHTGYFAGPAEEMPLLHTWSLAVEEQFYLLFPLLLISLFRFAAVRQRNVLIAVLSLGLLMSLGLSIYVVSKAPAAGFFLLPTRAWELLTGSMIAVLPAPPSTGSRRLRAVCAWVGLAAIIAPCFLYTSETKFPGTAALPPCLGAALFIWASRSVDTDHRLPLAARLLAMRPFVFIGLISYSLYLWHWPLFAFANYWSLHGMSLAVRAALLAATFALGVLSWRLVETPFRTKRLATTPRAMFGQATVGSGVVFCCSLLVPLSLGMPSRFPANVLNFAAAADATRRPGRVSLDDAVEGRFVRLGDKDTSAPAHVFLWGDSHARALVPAFEALCEEHKLAVEVASYSSTAPVLGFQQTFPQGLIGEKSVAWADAVFHHVRQQKIPHVVLAARWSVHLREQNVARAGKYQGRHFSEALLETVEQLSQPGTRVWIVSEVPIQSVAVPKALALHTIFPQLLPLRTATAATHTNRTKAFSALVPLLSEKGGRVLDVAPTLYDTANDQFLMSDGTNSLYSDSNHLSAAGALYIRGVFRPLIE